VHSRENVNTTDEEVKCLEELVVTEEEIFQITTDLSSLMDVKIKQNILKGLTIVTDSCSARKGIPEASFMENISPTIDLYLFFDIKDTTPLWNLVNCLLSTAVSS
jgi:hypothetical protein